MIGRLAGLAFAGLLLAGCSIFDGVFGEKEKEKLTGERISVNFKRGKITSIYVGLGERTSIR